MAFSDVLVISEIWTKDLLISRHIFLKFNHLYIHQLTEIKSFGKNVHLRFERNSSIEEDKKVALRELLRGWVDGLGGEYRRKLGERVWAPSGLTGILLLSSKALSYPVW